MHGPRRAALGPLRARRLAARHLPRRGCPDLGGSPGEIVAAQAAAARHRRRARAAARADRRPDPARPGAAPAERRRRRRRDRGAAEARHRVGAGQPPARAPAAGRWPLAALAARSLAGAWFTGSSRPARPAACRSRAPTCSPPSAAPTAPPPLSGDAPDADARDGDRRRLRRRGRRRAGARQPDARRRARRSTGWAAARRRLLAVAAPLEEWRLDAQRPRRPAGTGVAPDAATRDAVDARLHRGGGRRRAHARACRWRPGRCTSTVAAVRGARSRPLADCGPLAVAAAAGRATSRSAPRSR